MIIVVTAARLDSAVKEVAAGESGRYQNSRREALFPIRTFPPREQFRN